MLRRDDDGDGDGDGERWISKETCRDREGAMDAPKKAACSAQSFSSIHERATHLYSVVTAIMNQWVLTRERCGIELFFPVFGSAPLLDVAATVWHRISISAA